MRLKRNSYLRKLALLSAVALNLLPAFILNIAARLLWPVIKIKFGIIRSDRLGHFCVNTELYLLEKKKRELQYEKEFHLVSFQPVISNRTLKSLWEKVINVYPYYFVYSLVWLNSFLPDKQRYIAKSSAHDRDIHNLLDNSEPTLKLDEDFLNKGREVLREFGLPEQAKFVCLIVRDNAYLEATFPDSDFSYHEYRNSRIESYLPACEWLASQGIYTFRMGAIVAKKLASKSDLIIDYANSPLRSEFMDVYLGANCEFCISQGTGFDGLPMIFRRPIAYTNVVPIFYYNTPLSDSIGIFKHHIDRRDGRRLGFEEILHRGLGECMTTACFEKQNIDLEDNSAEEITELVKEMFGQSISNHKFVSKQSVILQKQFWEIFENYRLSVCGHSFLHGKFSAKVGSDYLLSNRRLLETITAVADS